MVPHQRCAGLRVCRVRRFVIFTVVSWALVAAAFGALAFMRLGLLHTPPDAEAESDVPKTSPLSGQVGQPESPDARSDESSEHKRASASRALRARNGHAVRLAEVTGSGCHDVPVRSARLEEPVMMTRCSSKKGDSSFSQGARSALQFAGDAVAQMKRATAACAPLRLDRLTAKRVGSDPSVSADSVRGDHRESARWEPA